MTSTRKKQIKTLGVLFVAIVGLAIGFGAFSSSLLVKTRLSVNPNNGTFNVKFSNSASTLDESQVVPTKSSDIFTAYNGVIDNSGIPTIANLGGEFTQPGETITYDFYTINMGDTKAYLTDVIFNNVDGESVNKKCTSVNGENQTQVDQACNSISIKVIMGTDKITGTRSIVGHELLPDGSEPVKVVIEYAKDAVLPEVEFDVEFGTISMIYNTLEGEGSTTPSGSETPSYTFSATAPDICYLSPEDGAINYYNPNASDCGTAGDIPAQVKTSSITMTFNTSKCEAFLEVVEDAQEGMRPSQLYVEPSIIENASTYCSSFATQAESMLAGMDFSEDLPLYLYFNNNFVDVLPIDGTMAIMFASLDVTIGEPTGEYHDVTEIGVTAFMNKNLSSVTLPSTLETIHSAAFTLNNLSSLSIPASVVLIEEDAFDDNENLEEVIFEGTRSSQLVLNGDGGQVFDSAVNNVTVYGSSALYTMVNADFGWDSENACKMSTDGDITTSSCITINN